MVRSCEVAREDVCFGRWAAVTVGIRRWLLSALCFRLPAWDVRERVCVCVILWLNQFELSSIQGPRERMLE